MTDFITCNQSPFTKRTIHYILNIGQSIVTEDLAIKNSVLAYKTDSHCKYSARTGEHKVSGMKRKGWSKLSNR